MANEENENNEPGENTEDQNQNGEHSQEENHEGESLEDRLARTENDLAKVRKEAASRRVNERELEKRLSEAKTDEDIQNAVAEYQEKVATLEHEILVGQVANTHSVPEALRGRLVGKTKEELEADAKALMAALANGRNPQVNEEDLNGGLDPADSASDETDMEKVVARALRGH